MTLEVVHERAHGVCRARQLEQRGAEVRLQRRVGSERLLAFFIASCASFNVALTCGAMLSLTWRSNLSVLFSV